MDFTNFFSDLTAETNKTLTYTPMTDEQYQISCVDDIAEWADKISGEWNGDEAGSQEERAHCADEIIYQCNKLKELIEEMGNL